MLKIEYIDYETEIDVYDITVPDTENFYANDILVHNCTEITLHADELHTYACVLSSMNAKNYDKWKNTDAVYVATIFLDCVNQELIEQGKRTPEMEKVVRGAEKGRPLGLGLLGFHTYLQEKMIPFESVDAAIVNDELFEHLNNESLRASQYLAKHLGEPEWCEGYGVRNTHRIAIAPNMCVTSDFKFKLADNTDISMKDFIIASGIDIDNIQNKQWVETKNKLSVKTPKGEKVVDRIWFNGFVEVYQLTFKKGDVEETIKCTDHHKFLSVDGTWKETVFAELGETFDGGWTLVAKDLLDEKEATFDIDVPEEHAYIMANGMITHNSSSVLCGGSSQGLEPIFSNVYQQKMAGGTVNRISQTLLRIMKERGVYSQELVDEIGMKFNGSVQDPSITTLFWFKSDRS